MTPQRRRIREELTAIGVSQAFVDRVEDAWKRLQSGESAESIWERHGAVVLEEACKERHIGN